MVGWVSSLFSLVIGWLSLWVDNPSNQKYAFENLPVCSVFVDAGPDTSLCYPGGDVILMGSVTGNVVYYEWSPSVGLSDPTILNPVADVTETTTYTLTAWGIDPENPNLVENGDFESGNNGFTSDYTYVVDVPIIQNEMEPQETYTVIDNPSPVHYAWSACNDHTPAGINMMLLNGSSAQLNVWCQSVDVTPNSWYNVAAWVTSVHPTSPAVLQFSVNGIQIGSIVNALSATCEWVPFNALWYSGSSSTANLCIVNLNTAIFGNDFALDDISMVELCSVEDEVTITIVEENFQPPQINGPEVVCNGNLEIYNAEFQPEEEIQSYQWSVSSEGNIVSGQGSPQVAVEWEGPGEGELCLTIETTCQEVQGCIEIIINNSPTVPLINGPASLCPGEIITLITAASDPSEQFDWLLPPEVTLIGGEGTNEIEIEWAGEGEVEICVTVTNECGSNDNCFLLTLFPDHLTLFDTVLCTGSTIEINGTIYGNGNWSGEELFTDANGCDSIVEIEIAEAPSLEFMVTEYLCPGDSLFLEGEYQTEEGAYTDQYNTASGCDSVVITEIVFLPLDTTWLTSVTCVEAEAGTTITTFNTGLCDSTIITQVILVDSDSTTISLSSCFPADTGQSVQFLTNAGGCDSIVVTNTSLLFPDTTLIFQSTCDQSQVGTFIQSLTNIQGCDSLVITTRFYLESDTTLMSGFVCSYSDTGTTSVLLINSSGCDSLVILQNIYAGSDTNYLFESSCNALDTGYVILALANQSGCDSIVSIYTEYLLSDTVYLQAISCEPQDTGIMIQSLINSAGCDSLVITSTSLSAPAMCILLADFSIKQPLCYGDSAVIYADILAGLAPFDLMLVSNDTLISFNYPSPGTYTFALASAGEYQMVLTSENGLIIMDTINVIMPSPLAIEANLVSLIPGFGVPCNGDTTAQAHIEILSPGTPPLFFKWSTNEETQSLFNLSAGSYSVTVTDMNGCSAIDVVTITEPPPMQYNITVNDITCFGTNDGSFMLSEILGGVPPWVASLDGGVFQPTLQYQNLSEGVHTIMIMDQNGCTIEEEFIINEPESWSVLLGPDTTIASGTPFILSPAIIGNPAGNVILTWSDDKCENCWTRTVQPNSNTTFHLTVTDENGCISSDEITIQVFLDRDLYIPNVFSPNGDLVNDHFLLFSNSLEIIEELEIFDRWGNLLYRRNNFQPNDPSLGWDGTFNQVPLDPGVFAYKAIVIFKDGSKEVKHGDVTLVR